MKKEKVEDAAGLKLQLRKAALRGVIEKFIVDQGLTNREALATLVPVLFDIFKSIAKTEDVSEEHVFGTFVKMFGAWDYLKTMKEG